MTLPQQAEAARILFAAVPVLGCAELRTLAFLLGRGAPGRRVSVTNPEIGRELGYHMASVAPILNRLKLGTNPRTGLPWIEVGGGTRRRTIVVNRMPAPEPSPPAGARERGPEEQALGIGPAAMRAAGWPGPLLGREGGGP